MCARRVLQIVTCRSGGHNEEASPLLAEFENVAAPLQVSTFCVEAMDDAASAFLWVVSVRLVRQIEPPDHRFDGSHHANPSMWLMGALLRVLAKPLFELPPDLSECECGRVSRGEYRKGHAPHGHLFDDAR